MQISERISSLEAEVKILRSQPLHMKNSAALDPLYYSAEQQGFQA